MSLLCFVLMPFGRRTSSDGRTINFDGIYERIVAPAAAEAGLKPVRADRERADRTFHKPMFEQFMLSQFVIADITGAEANVYYELGIRRGLRPISTVILFADGTTPPSDLALRAICYRTDAEGEPLEPAGSVAVIAARLQAALRVPHDDNPLFRLVQDVSRPEVDHSKTDTFRERFNYSRHYKDRLARARAQGAAAVREVMNEALGDLDGIEVGVAVDVLLSLRDVKAHAGMIELYERLPLPLRQARLIREQLGFALNREGRAEEATKVLNGVIAEFGPSSETNGLLGRVYKDRWEAATKAGRTDEAPALLEQAARTYLAGFQADWRDAYPGVNAVTLMEMMDEPPPEQAEILPVVRYSAARKAKTSADYWDHATLMELAVLARNQADALEQAEHTLAMATVGWPLESTEKTLRLIREMREGRGEMDAGWIKDLEDKFLRRRIEMESTQKAS
jgi:hypothetical protein